MLHNKASEILSNITVYNKYARYLKEDKRRETWIELVDRDKNMFLKKFPALKKEIEWAFSFVYNKQVLPSMRSLQFAGKAVETNNCRIFNCSYLPIDSISAFSEVMFLLLTGTGVGYSIQNKHIEKLPPIRKPLSTSKKYLIGDSIEGWADAIKVLMKSYMRPNSYSIRFDPSGIRDKGAELVTSGGKAPGPEPLMICLEKIRELLDSIKEGCQLEDYQIHDILCLIADAVLAGGIRRAAMISLFNIDSQVMLKCKGNFPLISIESHFAEGAVNSMGESKPVQAQFTDLSTGKVFREYRFEVDEPGYGKVVHKGFLSTDDINSISETNTIPWYHCRPHRGRANNSVVMLRSKLKKKSDFNKIWSLMKNSGCGEPGLYFTNNVDLGINPCSEINLKAFCMCNLTEVNAGDLTSQEDFNNRVKAAAFIGTLQASYTDFHYLRPIWKKTCEKDSLVGVGLTGIGSGVIFEYNIREAATIAVEENKRVAALIGINPAARVTTIKPAGSTSCVLGTSSGIHAWHAPFYLRRIRIGKNEYLYNYLKLFHPEIIEDDLFSPSMGIVRIPQAAPEGSTYRNESALNLLERVKKMQEDWIQPGHNSGENTNSVSCTCYVKENEWDSVSEWVWNNKETVCGLSFLPHSGGTYQQMPFEDITEAEYNKLLKQIVDVDLSMIREDINLTNLSGELACSADGCLVV